MDVHAFSKSVECSAETLVLRLPPPLAFADRRSPKRAGAEVRQRLVPRLLPNRLKGLAEGLDFRPQRRNISINVIRSGSGEFSFLLVTLILQLLGN